VNAEVLFFKFLGTPIATFNFNIEGTPTAGNIKTHFEQPFVVLFRPDSRAKGLAYLPNLSWST
jgi:hypothetical protein